MLNYIIQYFQAVRISCLNGGICVTVFIFTISILSGFFLLFVFAGVVWASIYLCVAAFLSSIYIHWLWRSAQTSHTIPISLPFVAAEAQTGLAASEIAALPTFLYQRYCKDSSNGIDCNGWVQCAICLGTVQIGEMVRKLPACKHLFHVDCIDIWLNSHITCPMCRSEVTPAKEPELPA